MKKIIIYNKEDRPISQILDNIKTIIEKGEYTKNKKDVFCFPGTFAVGRDPMRIKTRYNIDSITFRVDLGYKEEK